MNFLNGKKAEKILKDPDAHREEALEKISKVSYERSRDEEKLQKEHLSQKRWTNIDLVKLAQRFGDIQTVVFKFINDIEKKLDNEKKKKTIIHRLAKIKSNYHRHRE